MREQLTQYVNLLFAGAPDSEEIKQEILQNTLDRYDDLIAQGKSAEAAYRLAISGIGDINEVLGATPKFNAAPQDVQEAIPEEAEDLRNKKLRAVGIVLYIVCAIPLFILSDLGLETIGLTLTILLVAAATYLMIITGKKDDDEEEKQRKESRHPLKKSIGNLIWVIGLVAYFGISFFTGAWHITWLIFPISGCARGLSDSIIDLMEVKNNEN